MARLVAFFLVCLFSLTSSPCAANALTSIGVAPGRLEISVPAAQRTTGRITLSNSADEPCKVKCYCLDYARKSNGDIQLAASGESKWSPTRWIELDPKELTLGPGEDKEVSYSLSVPADTPPGEYWAVALFEATSAGREGVAVGGRVGTIVSLKVSPDKSGGSSGPPAWIYAIAITLFAVVGSVLGWRWWAGKRRDGPPV